eukprot:CAMPEP_0174242822 /NCGR_PEP_ID=MMETSP0417-20130205/29264_1 /TAXON_ID=242541 /ORGANISM="Mayorella sp, Strain BSH-02190019" /LENGTH=421 /DNA_ID=CAMNT_0015322257 /DNA_START=129 /DNA_END=1394 /DNA_ORIENTATION=-
MLLLPDDEELDTVESGSTPSSSASVTPLRPLAERSMFGGCAIGEERTLTESLLFQKLKQVDQRLKFTHQLHCTLVNDTRRALSKAHQTTTNPKESIDRVVQLSVNNTYSTTPSPRGTDGVAVEQFTLALRGRVLVKQGQRFVPVPSSDARFSDYVTRVDVNVDQFPPLSWIRTSDQHVDGVKITRQLNSGRVRPKMATIVLTLDQRPPVYQLTPLMAHFVGRTVSTSSFIISFVWDYVKANSLQDTKDPMLVKCDSLLQRLFEVKSFSFGDLPHMISRHFGCLRTQSISYAFSDEGDRTKASSYAFPLLSGSSTGSPMFSPFESSVETSSELSALNAQMHSKLERVAEARRKLQFLRSMVSDPCGTIELVNEEVEKDRHLAHVSDGADLEAERRSDFYTQPGMDMSVLQYLQSQGLFHQWC